MANEQTTPAQINPTVDPEAPATPLPPNDSYVYSLPEVKQYLATEAQLAALDKLRETEKTTFVARDPAAIEAENAIRNSQAEQAALLQQQGILQVLQRDAALEASATTKPPVGSLADYYNQQDTAEAVAENIPANVAAGSDPNLPVRDIFDGPPVEEVDLYEGVDPGLDAAIQAATDRFDLQPTESAIDIPTSADPAYADFDIPVTVFADHDIPTPLAVEEDPFEVARLAAEARNELVETYGPDQVGDEDPFEAARIAAENNFDGAPTETAVDVDPLSDEELNYLEQQQFINREQLAAENFQPEPVLPSQTGYAGVAYDDDGNLLPGYELDEDNNPVFVGYDSISGPAPVPPSQTGYSGVAYDDDGNLLPGWTLDEDGNPVYVGGDFVEPATAASAAASRTQALKLDAQRQNTLQNRVSVPASADWRVRLSLAQNATYLYRDTENAGIMAPLARTNGVIFPYTPNIETSYQAKYDSVDLTHSNYRGYFYRNSSVEAINIRGMFTAQDTREAEYLLAVITFFKSVTKMFYGATDPLAGTPPPLVFLSGLGQYQFNNHPCVVASFTYNLPSEVDYIRAIGFNNYGVNLDNRRQQSSGPPTSGILGAIATVNRLFNNGLSSGATNKQVSPGAVGANNSNTNYTNSTYVPTKMEISIQLLPIQTRSQISTQFNVQDFAAGKLLQQGFW